MSINKCIFAAVFFGMLSFSIQAQPLPKVSTGTITRIDSLKSEYVSTRPIDIWLPDGYSANKKYSVVYLHDGQMLFDTALCWNRREWRVDETFGQLIHEKVIDPCIVVGIWNTGGNRISEYLPNAFFNALSEREQNEFSENYCHKNGAQGDLYLNFLVKELKPYIDQHFATLTGPEHTFLMGSSMGGLISLYGLCEYPNVFGAAASLSTSWLSSLEPHAAFPLAAFNYLNQHCPNPWEHKIYMDYGTAESDSLNDATQLLVNTLLTDKGFNATNLSSRVFKDAHHTETDWANRLHEPVRFLMPKLQPQGCSSGSIDLYPHLPSAYITERTVEVWLPEDYSRAKKYAVLYMHDGQMLYDSTTSWNRQSWNVDEVASTLIKSGTVKDFIVVGIWNGGKRRHSEYFPQKPFESLSDNDKALVNTQLQQRGRAIGTFQPVSDDYLKFLVYELKPFIDKTYSTRRDRANTFIAGSSMGGLISLYAVCEYPDVFGGAACLSTHWPGIWSVENNPIPNAFLNYMKRNLPNPKTHRLYFDYGDQTLDALYPPLQKQADEMIKARGYTSKNWSTQYFQGKDHSEKSWNERLPIPLEFLLGK